MVKKFWCMDCPELESLKFIPAAKSYKVEPFTRADVDRELSRRNLKKEMSPTAKEDWGDTWDNL